MRTGKHTPSFAEANVGKELPVEALLLFYLYLFSEISNPAAALRKPDTFLSADFGNNRWLKQRSNPESFLSLLTKVLRTEMKIVVRDMFSGFQRFSCLEVSLQGVSCSS